MRSERDMWKLVARGQYEQVEAETIAKVVAMIDAHISALKNIPGYAVYNEYFNGAEEHLEEVRDELKAGEWRKEKGDGV